jgi:hypothetical protein
MIMANRPVDGEDLWSNCHFLPATSVDFKSGVEIKAYINRTKNPTTTIKVEGVTVVGKT